MLTGYNRADDGLRTRDLQLGKLALYQLSYVRVKGILARRAYASGTRAEKLLNLFGDEYLDCRRNVPRWVPRPRPWTQGSGRRS